MYTIKVGDTQPSLFVTLTPLAQSLTGAIVMFRMRDERPGYPVKVFAPAAVLNPATGAVRYDWASSDSDTPGLYQTEFVVTYSDTTVETFPNQDFFFVKVVSHL